MIKDPALTAQPENDRDGSLSFNISDTFKKEFKGYAVARGMSMTEHLKKVFALTKATNGS